MSYDTARERLEALPPGPLLGGEASRHVDVHSRRFAAHAPTDLALLLHVAEAAKESLHHLHWTDVSNDGGDIVSCECPTSPLCALDKRLELALDAFEAAP